MKIAEQPEGKATKFGPNKSRHVSFNVNLSSTAAHAPVQEI